MEKMKGPSLKKGGKWLLHGDDGLVDSEVLVDAT